MRGRLLVTLFAGILLRTGLAEDITGSVLIKRRLSKPAVSPPASLYERGPAVHPTGAPNSDPLASERERVVIFIDAPGSPRASSASMEQLNRRFYPDTIVIPVGSTVSFPNGDPIFHNVFSLSKAKSFDLGNYRKGSSRTVVFSKAGVVYVGCHLHPDMAAAIVVTPNQWYAKADRSGGFALHGIPPGDYSLVAWHHAIGFIRQEVKVRKREGATVTILLPFDEAAESGTGRGK